MPVEPVLFLIVAAVVANLLVMAVILVPPLLGRDEPARARDGSRPPADERRAAQAAVVGGVEGSATDDGVPTQTYDRVVRIVAWVFLLTTTVIVAATGLWPDTQPAILILLAFSGLFVVVVHDLLPPDTLGPAKFVVEGSVAITVATLLVALTGGVASPFFFAFPLIVGGAALVVSPTDHARLSSPPRQSATSSRSSPGRPADARTGHRRGRRGQPDGARPHRLCRDGHRPGAAPDARRGDPAVDGRLR